MPARPSTEDWTAHDGSINEWSAVLPRGTRGSSVRRLRRRPKDRPNVFRSTRASSGRFFRHLRQFSDRHHVPIGMEASRPYRSCFRRIGRHPNTGRYGSQTAVLSAKPLTYSAVPRCQFSDTIQGPIWRIHCKARGSACGLICWLRPGWAFQPWFTARFSL
jgi:hypothetical protein